MERGPSTPVLLELFRARADAQADAWFARVCDRLGSGRADVALLEGYTLASRRLGRRPLALSDAEQQRLAALDPDLRLSGWTLTDLGRALLLLEADAKAGDDEGGTVLVHAPYDQGDSDEQQGWLKALAVLPRPERFLAAAVDACRTNILPQFESIACENPFPARHFPDRNFNQVVLKALFNGIALERIVGLDRRVNPELSRMADDYVSEREAAGRSVPADIWLVIGPHAAGAALARMERYAADADPAHRHWASAALRRAGAASTHQRS